MVDATDGSAITAGVVAFHITGTTRAAVTGDVAAHVAGSSGVWTYTPTTAETDYDEFAIEFYHADAVAGGPMVQVVTSELEEMFDATGFDPDDLVDDIWDELQSGHVTAGTFGEIATEIASILEDTGTTIPGTITTLQGNVTSILEDTNVLQTDWTDGGRLDLLLDAAQRNVVLTESYAADGAEATEAQLLYMIYSCVAQSDLDSTDLDTYELDGTTVAMSFEITLNSQGYTSRRVRTL